MEFLNWAEMSPIGEWVSTSLWGYPIALTLHTIGMGTLVGLALMICFRVLGLGQGMPPSRLLIYWKLALIGFVINLISGTALFFGSATVLWESWPFRIKIVFISMGLIGTHYLVRRVLVANVMTTKSNPIRKSTGKQKTLACTVIFIWISALVAGRLIAYVY